MRCLSIILIYVLCSVKGYAEGTWTETTGLPIDLWAAPQAVGNGKIYYIGGQSDLSGTNFLTWDGSGSWTVKTKPPYSVYIGAGGFVSNKFCVAGGCWDSFQGNTNFQIWDGTNWTWGPKLLEGRKVASGVTWSNRLYLIGGFYTDNNATTNVQYWDGALWNSGPKLPYAIGMNAGTVFRNDICIIGSDGTSGTNFLILQGGTNWISGPTPVYNSGGWSALVTNNQDRLLLLGNNNGKVYSYDGTNWTQTNNTLYSHNEMYGAVNYSGNVFAIGGHITNVEYLATPVTNKNIYLYGVKINKLYGVPINKIYGRGQ